MSRRKTIAVVVTGYDWEYETSIVDGIYCECQARDINVLVFASLVRKPPLNMEQKLNSNIVRGEIEIFNLMNYNLIDGILILGDNLVREESVFEIEAKAKEYNIPVININDALRIIEHNILVDNREAMEHVVRHLIRDHGLTKINFIGGFPGNIQTEERLAAYKRVLAEYGLPYEEERVLYGEFWIKATECTNEFLDRDELPEAIVCASDTMAFFAIDAIKGRGLRVPEDIIVTGFDGIADCETHSPTLTTVRPPYRKLGVEGVKQIVKMWNGEKSEQIISIESELVPHQSCGCEKRVKMSDISYYNKKYDMYNDFKFFNNMLVDMNTLFSEVETSKELYTSIGDGANFYQFNRFYVCICDQIEYPDRAVKDPVLDTVKYGLTDKCVVMYAKQEDVEVGTEFETSQMLPVDILNNAEKPVFMAFSSLYFKDKYLGYVAYEPTRTHGTVGVLFQTWVFQISNNAGSFYMKKELQTAVDELEKLYAKDPLTGMYNRRGMEKNRHIIDDARKDNSYITVLAADVDNLKSVNDKYGHEGGDVVITRVAIAISEAMPEGAICVRTGGDEFLAFFKHESFVNMDSIINQVTLQLDDFNAKSGLPYKVGCSCGYYTRRMDMAVDFDEMCSIADERMYDTKKAKKTMR